MSITSQTLESTLTGFVKAYWEDLWPYPENFLWKKEVTRQWMLWFRQANQDGHFECHQQDKLLVSYTYPWEMEVWVWVALGNDCGRWGRKRILCCKMLISSMQRPQRWKTINGTAEGSCLQEEHSQGRWPSGTWVLARILRILRVSRNESVKADHSAGDGVMVCPR